MDSIYKQLQKHQKMAYVKYSKYHVAAMVETDKGNFFGVNIENAVYPLTICAERVSIFNAISNGAKKFNSLNLITDSHGDDGTPCGACRQVMSEHFDKKTKINVYSKNGNKKTYTIEELLPYAFSEHSMGRKKHGK